jgi:hypothetical protein
MTTTQDVIVRTYEGATTRQAERRLRGDEAKLERDGYVIARMSRNDSDSVLSWWGWPAAKVAIVVTYVRRH